MARAIRKAYQAGAAQAFPEASRCFDAFHVSKLVHDALETVRRSEAKQVPDLKGTRWGTLKHPKDWTRKQSDDRYWLQRSLAQDRQGLAHEGALQGHSPAGEPRRGGGTALPGLDFLGQTQPVGTLQEA